MVGDVVAGYSSAVCWAGITLVYGLNFPFLAWVINVLVRSGYGIPYLDLNMIFCIFTSWDLNPFV